jgi:hypothetical protein
MKDCWKRHACPKLCLWRRQGTGRAGRLVSEAETCLLLRDMDYFCRGCRGGRTCWEETLLYERRKKSCCFFLVWTVKPWSCEIFVAWASGRKAWWALLYCYSAILWV